MPHATHKARRIITSDVPHAPVKRRRSRFEQQALLAVSVSFTMLIIVALYAGSFKVRLQADIDDVEYPRWTVLDADFFDNVRPVRDNLVNVKRTLTNLAGAGQSQVQAAAILKAKIQARASASATPETSGFPETPESP